jgi:hypothetical protein
VINFTSEQLHQMLHVAWPELYQAALGSEDTWFTLWEGSERLDVKPHRGGLRLVEDHNYLAVAVQDFEFVAPVDLFRPKVGWAMSKHAEPFYFAPPLGLPREGETVLVHDIRAEIGLRIR